MANDKRPLIALERGFMATLQTWAIVISLGLALFSVISWLAFGVTAVITIAIGMINGYRIGRNLSRLD